MCGPSSAEKQVSAAQLQMYKNLNSNYATTFAQQQNITGALTKAFTPILQAGPYQAGYSPAEMTSLNTAASENIAQNYAAAQRATQSILAAQGGGNTLLPSSINANITAANVNAAAQARAAAITQNQIKSYQQGRENWGAAANVLTSTGQMVNPLGYAGASTSAGSQAFGSAQTMAQQQFQPWGAAIGALGGVAGAALGNWQNILPTNYSTNPLANVSMGSYTGAGF